jgi:GNAT superfamily N-acetyltransferase
MFDDPSMHGFVAEIDGQVAGYGRLFFSRDENRLYVSSLYFLPEFEGQGMGRRLLEAAEVVCHRDGPGGIMDRRDGEKQAGPRFLQKDGVSIYPGGTFHHGENDGQPSHRLQEYIKKEHTASTEDLRHF